MAKNNKAQKCIWTGHKDLLFILSNDRFLKSFEKFPANESQVSCTQKRTITYTSQLLHASNHGWSQFSRISEKLKQLCPETLCTLHTSRVAHG